MNIVIINDNSEVYLKNLFESLLGQESFDIRNVIFVDNCSQDRSVEVARRYGVGAFVSPREKEAHRGVLYNLALSAVHNEHVLFLHSDVFLEPDFFYELTQYLEENPDSIFLNFNQKYVDTSLVGPDWIGVEDRSGKFFHRRLFDFYNDVKIYSKCSEACFYLNKNRCAIDFSESYKQSLFEYDFLIRLGILSPPVVEKAIYNHYFIETHAVLDKSLYDLNLFLKEHGSSLYKKNGFGCVTTAGIFNLGLGDFCLKEPISVVYFAADAQSIDLDFDVGNEGLKRLRLSLHRLEGQKIQIQGVRVREMDGKIYQFPIELIRHKNSILAKMIKRVFGRSDFFFHFDRPISGMYISCVNLE